MLTLSALTMPIALTFIIGFAMAVVNTFKSKLPANVVPIVSVVLATLLNVGCAFLFGFPPLVAFAEGFVGSGIVVGLFASNDTQSNRTSNGDPTTFNINSNGDITTSGYVSTIDLDSIKPVVTIPPTSAEPLIPPSTTISNR